jgi:hypothetical protein
MAVLSSVYGTEGQRFESSRARSTAGFSPDLSVGVAPKVKRGDAGPYGAGAAAVTFLATFFGDVRAVGLRGAGSANGSGSGRRAGARSMAHRCDDGQLSAGNAGQRRPLVNAAVRGPGSDGLCVSRPRKQERDADEALKPERTDGPPGRDACLPTGSERRLRRRGCLSECLGRSTQLLEGCRRGMRSDVGCLSRPSLHDGEWFEFLDGLLVAALDGGEQEIGAASAGLP